MTRQPKTQQLTDVCAAYDRGDTEKHLTHIDTQHAGTGRS